MRNIRNQRSELARTGWNNSLLVTVGQQIAPADEQDLAVYGGLIDHHTLHDALLIANHRVRGTEAIVMNDETFTGVQTTW